MLLLVPLLRLAAAAVSSQCHTAAAASEIREIRLPPPLAAAALYHKWIPDAAVRLAHCGHGCCPIATHSQSMSWAFFRSPILFECLLPRGAELGLSKRNDHTILGKLLL